MTEDMCQCAGCFESRQAVTRHKQNLKLIEEVNNLKAKALPEKHVIYDKIIKMLLKRVY